MSKVVEDLARILGAAIEASEPEALFPSRKPAVFLASEERTPERFYEDLTARYRPDGYVYGTGMANVLSMVAAFDPTPRGLIMADPDPAAAAAGRMIAGALARCREPEGFVREIFCGGEKGLRQLAAVAADGIGAAHCERLWRGLGCLTHGFSLQPTDAPGLLARWAGHDPTSESAVPVMTFVIRGYAKLHALARDGRLVVLGTSPFNPDLIAAVRSLPGFASSSNLIYLADEVTQILRRSLFASARARLCLRAAGDPEVRSTREFVAYLNSVLERLTPLVEGSRNAVCVYSSEENDLLLTAEAEVPRFSGDGFYFQFDLDRMVLRFFETGEDSVDAIRKPAQSGWPEAPGYRALALHLFGAAVRGDVEDARSALAGLEREWARPAGKDNPAAYAAFRLAELGEALWMLEKSALAAQMPDQARRLGEEVGNEARRLAARLDELLRQAAGRSKDLLLFAQAFQVAGRLARDGALADRGEPFLAAALALQSEDGLFLDRDGTDLGLHVEALLRLTLCALHRPAHAANDMVARGLERLLPAVRLDGGLNLPPAGGYGGDGYTAYAVDASIVHENARLAFLFHGLSNEDLDASRTALRMHFYPGRRGASAAFGATTT